MFLRDRIKTAITVVFFVVVALVAGLGVGYGMWEIGIRGFLTAGAWMLVILLVMGCQTNQRAIVAAIKENTEVMLRGMEIQAGVKTEKDDG